MNTAATSGDDEIVRIPTEARCGGEWVTIGLDSYRLAPINFERIKEPDFQSDLMLVSQMPKVGLPTAEQLRAAERIILASLTRNYPSKTLADVAGMVDLGNSVRVLGACLGISGYIAGKAPGALGEALASTGTSSIAP